MSRVRKTIEAGVLHRSQHPIKAKQSQAEIYIAILLLYRVYRILIVILALPQHQPNNGLI